MNTTRATDNIANEYRHNASRPTNLRLEASNPIYEGAVYESIPGESFKSLDISTPDTLSADSISTSRCLTPIPSVPKELPMDSSIKSFCSSKSAVTMDPDKDTGNQPSHQKCGDEYEDMN